MLQLETPLSSFLLRYGIKVDVDNNIIEIKEKKYPILSYNDSCPYCLEKRKEIICDNYNKCKLKERLEGLALKLYNYGATVEFFINSKLSRMKNYSTIDRYPEILYTISSIYSCIQNSKLTELSLGIDWANERSKCYIIQFLATLSDMETYAPMDY